MRPIRYEDKPQVFFLRYRERSTRHILWLGLTVLNHSKIGFRFRELRIMALLSANRRYEVRRNVVVYFLTLGSAASRKSLHTEVS